MFLISTYNTMAYSSFEKYGKYTEAERNAFKAEIDKVAKGQQNYLDFWSRLSLDKVRNQLLKSNNMVPTPVLDNQNYKGISTDRYGHTMVVKMWHLSVNCMDLPTVTTQQIGVWELWLAFMRIHIRMILSSLW